MARSVGRAVRRGIVLSAVVLLAGSPAPRAQTSQPQPQPQPLSVTPTPVGPARMLVDTRAADPDALPPLPVEGLVPAGDDTTRTRGLPEARGVGLAEPRLLPVDGVLPEVRSRSASGPTVSVEAGPIWSQSDAHGKCAAVQRSARFSGSISGTRCRCTAGSVRPVGVDLEMGRLDASSARTSCSSACADASWTGHWWTTVPGRMSVCQLRWAAPPTPAPEPEPTPEPEATPAAPSVEQMQAVYSLLGNRVSEINRLRAERQERQRQREEGRKQVQGPSALAAIDLLEGLHVDPSVGLAQSDVLQIDHQVYQDGNDQSGLFYYVPKRFDLAWNPQDQYGMKVIYGMAGSDQAEGEVFMAARLDAGVDLAELRLAKELLVAYVRRHASDGLIRFRELRPLPLRATSDVELFGGNEGDFSIPPEKISVQGVSGLLGVVDISWSTDVRRLLNVETLLRTDAGIHGSLTLHAASEDAFTRAIPLDVEVASPQTFGRMTFDRQQGWSNQTPYPIRLRHLHALLICPEDRGSLRKFDPVVFSWDLAGTLVAPGAPVQWDARFLPGWIDQHAKLMWITYAVDASCDECDDRVFDQKFIPKLPSTRALVITTGDAFESSAAERIMVRVRSPFLDPQRNRIVEQEAVTLTEDGVEYPIAKLFLSDRELTGAGVHEPFYELRLELQLPDGRSLSSPRWMPSRELDLLLGSASLERLLETSLDQALSGPEAP